MQHRIASHDEWLAARKAHLAKEKELTRLRDKLSGANYPGSREKTYVFDTRDEKTLAELFEERSQLRPQRSSRCSLPPSRHQT